MINFTGRLVHTSRVPATTQKGKNTTRQLSLYTLDPKSSYDNIVIQKLSQIWHEDDMYLREILRDFRYDKYNTLDGVTEEFFVLAENEVGRTGYREENILGIAQTSFKHKKKYAVEIDYFQTIPNSLKAKNKYIYEDLGTKFMDKLKIAFRHHNLWLYSTKESMDFYIHNGFKHIADTALGLPVMKYLRK